MKSDQPSLIENWKGYGQSVWGGLDRVVCRMTRTTFSFRRLGQVAQDAALTGSLRRMAGVAQGMQLPFKQPKGFDLLVNTANLPVNQLIDLFARQFRPGLEAAQDAHLRQSDAQRAAMADEVELHQMGFGVVAVAVGFTRGGVEQSFPFIEAHRFDVAAAQLRQFSDSHTYFSTKSLDPVLATDCQILPLFPERHQYTSLARLFFAVFIPSRNCKCS